MTRTASMLHRVKLYPTWRNNAFNRDKQSRSNRIRRSSSLWILRHHALLIAPVLTIRVEIIAMVEWVHLQRARVRRAWLRLASKHEPLSDKCRSSNLVAQRRERIWRTSRQLKSLKINHWAFKERVLMHRSHTLPLGKPFLRRIGRAHRSNRLLLLPALLQPIRSRNRTVDSRAPLNPLGKATSQLTSMRLMSLRRRILCRWQNPRRKPRGRAMAAFNKNATSSSSRERARLRRLSIHLRIEMGVEAAITIHWCVRFQSETTSRLTSKVFKEVTCPSWNKSIGRRASIATVPRILWQFLIEVTSFHQLKNRFNLSLASKICTATEHRILSIRVITNSLSSRYTITGKQVLTSSTRGDIICSASLALITQVTWPTSTFPMMATDSLVHLVWRKRSKSWSSGGTSIPTTTSKIASRASHSSMVNIMVVVQSVAVTLWMPRVMMARYTSIRRVRGVVVVASTQGTSIISTDRERWTTVMTVLSLNYLAYLTSVT